MSSPKKITHAVELEIKDLPQNRPTVFDYAPAEDILEEIRQELNLLSLKKVRFTGEVCFVGKGVWKLSAHLGSSIEQSCVVSLAPVKSRIDTQIDRLYDKNFEKEFDAELEFSGDDTREPLPATIDLKEVLREAISLSMPDFPRAEGVAFEAKIISQPGVAPLDDAAMRPFAGLAALKDKLSSQDND